MASFCPSCSGPKVLPFQRHAVALKELAVREASGQDLKVLGSKWQVLGSINVFLFMNRNPQTLVLSAEYISENTTHVFRVSFLDG